MPTPATSVSQPEDFAELMAAHQPQLMGYICSLVGNPDIARDILQETNVVLLRKARDFQPGSNFTAWAHRVAYFEVLTFRRRMGRERLVFSEKLQEIIAEEEEEDREHFEIRRRALMDCVKNLPESQQQAVTMRYIRRMPVAGIADETGMRPNAVSQLLFRAKQNLARCVERKLGLNGSGTADGKGDPQNENGGPTEPFNHHHDERKQGRTDA